MSFSKNLCLAYQNKLGQKKSEFGRIKRKAIAKIMDCNCPKQQIRLFEAFWLLRFYIFFHTLQFNVIFFLYTHLPQLCDINWAICGIRVAQTKQRKSHAMLLPLCVTPINSRITRKKITIEQRKKGSVCPVELLYSF